MNNEKRIEQLEKEIENLKRIILSTFSEIDYNSATPLKGSINIGQLDLTNFNTGKPEKPKEITCWEDLEIILGAYVSDESTVCPVFTNDNYCTEDRNKNIFPTTEMAKASIAMAQLAQLMKHEQYNGSNQDEWCDWNDKNNPKFEICYYDNEIGIYPNYGCKRFLAFKTKEKAELFLKNHRDLIEIAKPLL